MNISLTTFYTQHIKDIITILKHSSNGKRIWTEVNGVLDYSQTTRSTYPEFVKFYFVKTPKLERINYYEVNSTPWTDGYFNGTTRDLLKLFENALTGKMPRSERMIYVFDTCIEGYFQELEDLNYY